MNQEIADKMAEFDGIFRDGEIDIQAFMEEHGDMKIRSAAYYIGDLMELLLQRQEKGDKAPWDALVGKFIFRPAELTIWSGAKGHGKSLAISQVFERFLEDGKRAFIISPEFPPHRVLHRMLIQSFGVENATPEVAFQWLEALESSLFLYEQQKSLRPQEVPALCRFATEVLKVDHILIDSLMKCGVGVDDLTAQKNLVDQIQQVAHNTGCHIHLVAHAKKGAGDEKIGSLHDVKGASEIADMAENVIFVWRNKKKEIDGGDHGEPDCIVKVEAQRNGDGWIGQVPLWFNKSNFTFRDAL